VKVFSSALKELLEKVSGTAAKESTGQMRWKANSTAQATQELEAGPELIRDKKTLQG
jgi:hypothetical protein